jgi:MFS transporter, DHA2 family, multidrug resistance protein
MAQAAPISHPPLQGMQLVLGTVSVSLALFMNVLDSSIANVAIPTISGNLGVSSDQGTWVITSFAVANAISVPLTGWLTERFGQVRLFLISILLFVVSSWMCGLAPSLPFLLFSRVLQGAVAGPMIPLSQSLLLASYPRAKASIALSMWSTTALVAPVVGPILGGWISDNYSWPWIFYVNVPIGLVAAFAIWSIYRKRESVVRRAPIDVVGLTLLVVWVGSLQIMLDKGKDLDWFQSTTIIALALTAVIAFAFFVIWELTEKHPVVDLSLFKGRNFTSATIALSVGYGLYFGNLVLLPLWLQTDIGYTATQAGIVLAPVGFFAIILSPITGRILPRTDPRYIASIAFLIFGLCFWMRAGFTTNVDEWTLMVPTFVQGIGMAGLFIPLISISISGLPGHRIPAASGLSNFVRIMCGGIGTSIFETSWDHRTTLHHAQLTEQLSQTNAAYAQTVNQAQSLGLGSQQTSGLINSMVDQQAAQLGVNDLFYLSSIIFVVLIGLIWFTRPERTPSGAAGNQNNDASASAAH